MVLHEVRELLLQLDRLHRAEGDANRVHHRPTIDDDDLTADTGSDNDEA